ncbi:MAG: type II toxin-antitoxin system VapC family toxin [Planctomycetota bacterium]|jgi:PIN domain nuclease of toxin-antitoxin system
MKIILDTHIFLWSISDPDKISKERKTEIESLANIIYISAVSITEIMIKSSIGKFKVNFDPVETAIQSGFEMLDFSCSDALPLKDLPFHHKDPFDRMLIAQSISNKCYIMSDDEKFKDYKCKLI